jgi:tetratricopeptide (TPR) repeat protein
MKAEHRKELQTNALASQVTKLMERTRSSSGVVWALLLLIVVVGLVYWWWTGRTVTKISAAWRDYWRSRESAEGLKLTMDDLKGTAAERAAKLSRADLLYEEGYQALFKNPAEARKSFDEAAELYDELAGARIDSPEFTMRALLGAGKCQESVGELDRAKHYYNELISRFGGQKDAQGSPHPLLADARKRLEHLDAAGGLAAFYKNWPGRLPKISMAEPKKPEPPRSPTDIKPPEAKAPEAKAPEAKAPEAKSPEAKSPEAKSPESK